MLNLFQYRSWALSEVYFNRMFPLVTEWLKHGHSMESMVKKPTNDEMTSRMKAMVAAESDVEFKIEWDRDAAMVVAKGAGKKIGLVSMIGPITKYGDLCSYGTRDYQSMIDRMNRPGSEVDGMVLVIDSPGGTVDGTPELALTVKSSKKPIGVFGDALVASAALWIASQSKVIVGNKNNPTEFGSIGTLVVSQNWQNVMDAGNYPKLEIIRAPQSTDKALFNYIEPLNDDVRNELLEDLKVLTNDFISAVKNGRGSKLNTKLEGLFSGRMFDVNTAKQNGLIDSIGTLATAINKVADLARQQSREGTNVSTNTSAESMKFPKLSNLFSGEAWSKVAGIFSSDEDMKTLEATEKKVADQEAENTRLKEEAQAKDAKITTLEATVSEQKAQITTLEGEKSMLTTEKADLQKKLDEKPKGHLTTVIPGKTEVDGGETQTREELPIERQAREAASSFSTNKSQA